MTPEQQREQWLKRILPALGVLVVYFVLVSGFVTEKSKKSLQQYQSLKAKGIDAAQMQGINLQHQQVKAEIATLEQQSLALIGAMDTHSGAIARSDSVNSAIKMISIILDSHHLQVLDENREDNPKNDNLPKSLRDTQQWLRDVTAEPPATPATTPPPAVQAAAPANANPDTKGLTIWTIHYVGTYLDNYQALSDLAESAAKVVPVSLTMHAYKAAKQVDAGKQEWLLTLWL